MFTALLQRWNPEDAVVTIHQRFSRSEVLNFTPVASKMYRVKRSKAMHSQFGGVTISSWHLVHYSRVSEPITASMLMTKEHYPQVLQSSLDDTVGKSQVRFSFEPHQGGTSMGTVTLKKNGSKLPVNDSNGLGPDLGLIRSPRFWFFWVFAHTVWSKEQIIRPIKLGELFSFIYLFMGLRRQD